MVKKRNRRNFKIKIASSIVLSSLINKCVSFSSVVKTPYFQITTQTISATKWHLAWPLHEHEWMNVRSDLGQNAGTNAG